MRRWREASDMAVSIVDSSLEPVASAHTVFWNAGLIARYNGELDHADVMFNRALETTSHFGIARESARMSITLSQSSVLRGDKAECMKYLADARAYLDNHATRDDA